MRNQKTSNNKLELNATECRHTPAPEGIMAWHLWSRKMSETHDQIKCEARRWWLVWVKKGAKK